MAVVLDLADIQGNILRAYGKQGFPKGAYNFFIVDDARRAGRRGFVNRIMLPMITTRAALAPRSESTTSATGTRLSRLERPPGRDQHRLHLVRPVRARRSDPHLARHAGRIHRRHGWSGRRCSATIQPTRPGQAWDESGRNGDAERRSECRPHSGLVERARWTPTAARSPSSTARPAADRSACAEHRRRRAHALPGHSPHGQRRRYQELSAVTERDAQGKVSPLPTGAFRLLRRLSATRCSTASIGRSEHVNKDRRRQAGAVDGTGSWRPLATGEFLLGYPDEAQEIPGAAMPLELSAATALSWPIASCIRTSLRSATS